MLILAPNNWVYQTPLLAPTGNFSSRLRLMQALSIQPRYLSTHTDGNPSYSTRPGGFSPSSNALAKSVTTQLSPKRHQCS